MTTTITPPSDPPATLPGSPPPARRTGAVLALARFEARELLLQIPVLVFFALYVGLVAVRLTRQEGMDDYPILHMVDRDTQTSPMLLAIALLICTNAAALRSRKHGTVQQFDVLALEPWRRTLAHLLSVVPFAALTAVVAGAAFTREALKPGAIGHGSLGELAVGPLTVLLAGITGVLLARLLPSSFAPMLFVVAMYLVIMIASAVADEGRWVGWLSPIQYSDISGGDEPVPSDLLGRPAAWHALYLVGLCALLSCAAILLSRGRTRLLKAATAVSLAATVAGVIGQVPRDTESLEAARNTASTTPQKVQSCRTYGGSTYCAFPEWNGVRDDWARVVDRVQSAAGGTAAETRLTVRQRVDLSGGVEVDTSLTPSSTPGEVTVGTRWGGNRVPEFAVGVATVLVAGTEEETLNLCDDARPVTIMWLVLGTDPTPMSTFRTLRLDDSVSGSAVILAPTNGLSLTAQQTTVIRELLTRPRTEVAAQVKAHWTELTSSETSTAEAAKLLGVAVPKGAESCEE
ncbi:ABC transporter permease [Streptomyces aurantiogriseus]|uniref:ABC transporter n=1 Tax=Streptomyces aurantiogriseus TaxID=66870 RepID=A0A918FJU7_9ACTN|nr:ABC transporter permease [Streptomyces aurantiogriseus]GGR44367.1 ABC transporter [Streptomyces aurantiogriseus]